MHQWKLDIGAELIGKEKVNFRVWAPRAEKLSVNIFSDGKLISQPLEKKEKGYFEGQSENVHSGDRYMYRLNDGPEFPDPASRYQPEGVHAPSQVIDPYEFKWNDGDWKGSPLKDYIIYELHVGTFTKEGTFEAIISCLDYLKYVGISAIELMPVSQFPGSRNWGYDGVYHFAPQNSYGGPDSLKRLVDACHRKGIAVILDVVYNHLGPEGNYLNNFGYYFTDRYRTPWGEAVNFDGPHSDEVRKYFISNALYWTTEYHIDALRLDAIHGIFDFSARHILLELAEAVHEEAESLHRKIHVIAESDLNDVRVINPPETGGFGLDAQWNDDFHHALRVLLANDSNGYYEDFGKIEHLEKAYREGFIYSGQYSSFRKRRHGSSSKDRPAQQLVVFSQNHDQVGNRMHGDRLSQTQSSEKLKLAAGAVLLSPYIPLLFMGEEYGETAPFQYFVSHGDQALIDAVRKGRKEEFSSFEWKGEIPDPQAESTFMNSKIDINRHRGGEHRALLEFYRKLIRMRKEIPAFYNLSKEQMEVQSRPEEKVLSIRRWFNDDEVFCIFNFNDQGVGVEPELPEGTWEEILNSCEEKIHAGSRLYVGPYCFVLYRRTGGKG
jgi:maltooligosyltrehalose trehalohydrolase